MTVRQIADTKAPGCSMPGALALSGFIAITNTIVVTLQQLAEDVRGGEPGTAEVITAFTEVVAGQAIDLIRRWPA